MIVIGQKNHEADYLFIEKGRRCGERGEVEAAILMCLYVKDDKWTINKHIV